MSRLIVKSQQPGPDGRVLDITPESAGWKYVGFSVWRLIDGQDLRLHDHARETCIVVLTGRVSVSAGGESYPDIGGRASLFEDLAPAAVYVPAGIAAHIVATGEAEIALCTAPGQSDGAVRYIAPEDIGSEVRGTGSNRRFVRNILPETELADSLLIAEVVTPAGGWSSYPPHKHDVDDGDDESALEETYYHRVRPSSGFAFQRVYTDDREIDETMTVVDGDVVMVPRGYHPVGAAHGYELYYLNVMAGPRRAWRINNDPAHAWILNK